MKSWVLLTVSSLSMIAPLSGCGDDDSDGNAPRDVDSSEPTSDAGRSLALPSGCAAIELTYADFAEPFFAQRCVTCHSVENSGDARQSAPVGVNFDLESDLVFNQVRDPTARRNPAAEDREQSC